MFVFFVTAICRYQDQFIPIIDFLLRNDDFIKLLRDISRLKRFARSTRRGTDESDNLGGGYLKLTGVDYSRAFTCGIDTAPGERSKVKKKKVLN